VLRFGSGVKQVAETENSTAACLRGRYSLRLAAGNDNIGAPPLTIFLGVITLLLLLVGAVGLIRSARKIEGQLNSLLDDQVARIQQIEQNLERLQIESNRMVPR
jgi:hypothetical protein